MTWLSLRRPHDRDFSTLFFSATAADPAHGTAIAVVAFSHPLPNQESEAMRKSKLVMVGNGMAGVRTLEELIKVSPDL